MHKKSYHSCLERVRKLWSYAYTEKCTPFILMYEKLKCLLQWKMHSSTFIHTCSESRNLLSHVSLLHPCSIKPTKTVFLSINLYSKWKEPMWEQMKNTNHHLVHETVSYINISWRVYPLKYFIDLPSIPIGRSFHKFLVHVSRHMGLKQLL